MNSQAQHEITKLMVSWSLAGAIIFTLVITLLALTGWLALSDHTQLKKLFFILGGQIIIVGVTFALGMFQLTPGAAVNRIEQPLNEAAAKQERENKAALAEQDRLKGELAETKRELANSIEKANAYDEQIVKANANAEAQRETIAHLQDLAQHPAPQPPVDNSEEITALKARAERAEAELAESKQIDETLNQRLKETASRTSALQESKREKERQLQRAKAIGRVLAINPGWNFVVLSIGDKQGVTPDSTLLVLRGGAQIGKVRVKTIEPTKSIADVIISTLRKGITVQPGDTVVFEEIQSQPVTQPIQLSPPTTSSTRPGGVIIEPALPPLPSISR
jgi:cell shape-determining protein MreC